MLKKILARLKKTNTIKLNSAYLSSVPSSISYSDVKRALNANSLNEVIRVFEHFKRFDSQISGELTKRQNLLIGKPLIIASEDKAQDEFLKKLVNCADFRIFLRQISSAIPYGFAGFIINFTHQNGFIFPKFSFISHRYFDLENDKLYINQGANKIFLDDDERFYLHIHPSDAGDMIEQGLMYKVLCIASLKHISLMKYMTYLDSFAVPPIIIKSDSIDSEEQARDLFNAALRLRSNSIGLFSANDTLEILNGNVDKGTFLEFIRYCDESISKIITSQVLGSNSVQNGTQALGNIHNEVQKAVIEYDAMLLNESVQKLLELVLGYNFASIAPFRFEIDTNTEKDEKLAADTYAILSNMGVQIPLEHLEKTFKITGLNYSELKAEKNKEKKYLPYAKIDKELDMLEFSYDDTFDRLLNSSQTFEEALKKLSEIYSGKQLSQKEEELMQYFFNADIMGRL